MRTGIKRIRPALAPAPAALTLVLLTAIAAAAGLAQTTDAEPQDLQFQIVNATTGEPGTVDRITIDYVTARPNGIADFQPSGSEFTAPGVPLKEGGKYYVTVWRQGVPYWWEKRGHQLVAGPNVLHVFDIVSSLESVTLAGMNVVARQNESLLQLEYLLQVDNAARPQVVVRNSPATFEIDLPRGATEIQATYSRGPEPTPVPVRQTAGGRVGLDLPLTPGLNQIRLTAMVPWTEGMEVSIGANLPVKDWSVLASPEWLEITAMELEENDETPVAGYRRYVGPALESGESLALRLTSGAQAAGEPEDAFASGTGTDETAQPAADEQDGSGGIPLPLLFLGLVLIVVVYAAVKKRQAR